MHGGPIASVRRALRSVPQRKVRLPVAQWYRSEAVADCDADIAEDNQTPSFTCTTDHDALFATLPAVSPSGTLTFTPAAEPGCSSSRFTEYSHDASG